MLFEGYTGGGSKDMIDGLMSTGDVGYLDDQGRLFVEGRDDDMIVSGGENVFPQEVEDLIARQDGVEEVAVIGVDDKEFGQRLKAYVVKKKGGSVTEDVDQAGGQVEPRALQGAARGRVHRRAAAQRDRQGAEAGAEGAARGEGGRGRLGASPLRARARFPRWGINSAAARGAPGKET